MPYCTSSIFTMLSHGQVSMTNQIVVSTFDIPTLDPENLPDLLFLKKSGT